MTQVTLSALTHTHTHTYKTNLPLKLCGDINFCVRFFADHIFINWNLLSNDLNHFMISELKYVCVSRLF